MPVLPRHAQLHGAVRYQRQTGGDQARGQNAAIPDEPRKESNKRGRISFATSGPNTRSTTLFINLVDNAYLDPLGFTPIGEVVEGMENADKLYNAYGDTSTQQRSFETGGKAFVDQRYPQAGPDSDRDHRGCSGGSGRYA